MYLCGVCITLIVLGAVLVACASIGIDLYRRGQRTGSGAKAAAPPTWMRTFNIVVVVAAVLCIIGAAIAWGKHKDSLAEVQPAAMYQ